MTCPLSTVIWAQRVSKSTFPPHPVLLPKRASNTSRENEQGAVTMKRGHRHIVVLLLVFWVWFTVCAVYELGWNQARLQWPIAIIINLVGNVLWYVLVFSANVVNQYPQLLQVSSFSQLWSVLSQIVGRGHTKAKDFLTWWTWGIVAVLTGLSLVGSSQKLREFVFIMVALLTTKLGLDFWY